ncbi:MAG: cupin domain-containing protein [Candidatus Aminicenantales bacterium]
MVKNRATAPKVEWRPEHFAWAFLDSPELSVKLEEIPPQGRSEKHSHRKSRQFFFILEGRARFLKEEHSYSLEKHEAIEVEPEKSHQILNSGQKPLLFLLISYPRVG